MWHECLLNWGLGVGCQANSPQSHSNVVSSSGLHRSRRKGSSPTALSGDHGESGESGIQREREQERGCGSLLTAHTHFHSPIPLPKLEGRGNCPWVVEVGLECHILGLEA